MFEIIENNMNGRRAVIATEATFEGAKARVESYGVAFMDDDADYPNCADAYLADGRVIAIQPEGFTVKAADEFAKGVAMAKERSEAMASFDKEFGL